jgi:hypothetical protein
VFTIDAPSGQRLLIMVTSVYLFGGLFVTRALEAVRAVFSSRANWLAVPVATSVALLLLALNVTMYFSDLAPQAIGASATYVARELNQNPSDYHAYVLTEPIFYPGHGAVKFIARDVPIEHLKNAADFKPPPADGRGIVIVALEHRLNDLKLLEQLLPGGSESTYRNPLGRLVYVAYRVPPGAVATPR